MALLHGLVEVASLARPPPDYLHLGGPFGVLALGDELEGLVKEEELGELLNAVEDGDDGEAKCHIDQEESWLSEVVTGVFLVAYSKVQHHSQ